MTVVRHAPKHSSLHALVPDHEKIGLALGCELDQHLRSVTLRDLGRALDSLVAQLAFQSSQDLLGSSGVAGGPLNLRRAALRSVAGVQVGA